MTTTAYSFRSAPPLRRGLLAALAVAGALAGSAALAEGDAENGRKLFKKCMACHTTGEGQPSRMGPNLHNVFGRTVGSLEGFRYSAVYQAARETGEIWTPEKFLSFIENPREVYTPSTMVITIKDAQERADLLAFLLTESPGYKPEAAGPAPR